MLNREHIQATRAMLEPLLVPVAAVAIAVLAGAFAALAGARAGGHAVYYIGVVGVIGAGGAFALTRAEPLRFAFLALFALLPFVHVAVPPGRLQLSVFDVATVLLTVGLLLHMAFAKPGEVAPLFPARSLLVMWLLLLPCVVFARHPLDATQHLVVTFGAYVFFWFVLQELQRPGGLERLVGMLGATTMVVALALFVDYAFHINLSMQGANLNQITYVGHMSIWRAGGIFQDGQKAGAFLSASLVFLMVIGMRGRCRHRGVRVLLWSAVLLGVPALFVTVSRAALFSFVPLCVLALVLANRWPTPLKLFSIAGLVLLGASFMFAPQSWMSLLPTTLGARIGQSQAEMANRMQIWMDTWEMFARHPLTGVGPGGFRQYLVDTRPTMSNYYGLGEFEGVAYVPDQPESGYFKVLYESGVLGSVAALILIVATLHRAFRALLRDTATTDERTELIAALAGLGVFASTFVTLFTLADSRLLALMAFMMAVAWRPSIASSNPPARA